MSDLLQKLKLGKDSVKLVNFPGTTQKVALQILSQHELQLATFNTDRLFQTEKITVNMVNADDWDQEKATQILFLALRDPADMEQPIAKNITEFRKALTKDEKEVLIDEYLTFEKDVSPRSETLSDDEFDRVVSDVKKNADSIYSSNFSTNMLKKLVHTLANQPLPLPQDNG
jgi:hypothetical protein